MVTIIKKRWLTMAPLLMITLSFSAGCSSSETGALPTGDESRIALPGPELDSDTSVEESLLQRRSVRDYTEEALTLSEVAQLLWAAQGITSSLGQRTAPSAGGLYPLEVYVVIGNVKNVPPGVYKYRPEPHELVKVIAGEQREALAEAALSQSPVRDGAIDIVFTAIYERTTGKYGDRGVRYVYMEAGHAAQNVYLQAVALDLGAVVIGAFYDDQVKRVLNLPKEEEPLYIMPVGRKKGD